jgi:hypothetical protein
MYGGNPYPFPFPQEGSLNKLVQGNTAGPVNAATGFGPARVDYTDSLNKPDSAKASLVVADWVAGNGPVETLMRKNNQGQNLTFQTRNYNLGTISGQTNADTPMDSAIHSARSGAGMQIAGTPFVAAKWCKLCADSTAH